MQTQKALALTRLPRYRRGDCVRSWYGMGQVLIAGDLPLVRFLDGREARVSEASLTRISWRELAAEIENRTGWSLLLTLYIEGRDALEAWEPPWVCDAEGIWHEPRAVVNYSVDNETSDEILEAEFRVLDPDRPNGSSSGAVTSTGASATSPLRQQLA